MFLDALSLKFQCIKPSVCSEAITSQPYFLSNSSEYCNNWWLSSVEVKSKLCICLLCVFFLPCLWRELLIAWNLSTSLSVSFYHFGLFLCLLFYCLTFSHELSLPATYYRARYQRSCFENTSKEQFWNNIVIVWPCKLYCLIDIAGYGTKEDMRACVSRKHVDLVDLKSYLRIDAVWRSSVDLKQNSWYP